MLRLALYHVTPFTSSFTQDLRLDTTRMILRIYCISFFYLTTADTLCLFLPCSRLLPTPSAWR